ncbi:receptor-interacting serine/threonine-protein kinase 3 isoform X1 [Tachysurus ichikawai]
MQFFKATIKELKQHKEPTKKTLATPTQEIGPIPAPNRAGMYCSSAPRAPFPVNMQRQFSSPSSVNMCLSNVSAVQIGNNNYMNVTIQKGRQRQRHPTAPPATRQPSKHQN